MKHQFQKSGKNNFSIFLQRGIDVEQAISLMISGFCHDVFLKLPMEFSVEADKLLSLKLEGSIDKKRNNRNKFYCSFLLIFMILINQLDAYLKLVRFHG